MSLDKAMLDGIASKMEAARLASASNIVMDTGDVATLVGHAEDCEKKLAQARQEYAQLHALNQQQADTIDELRGADDVARATTPLGDGAQVVLSDETIDAIAAGIGNRIIEQLKAAAAEADAADNADADSADNAGT